MSRMSYRKGERASLVCCVITHTKQFFKVRRIQEIISCFDEFLRTIAEQCPRLIERSLVQHGFYSRCQTIYLNQLDHETISKMQAGQFFRVCISINVELSDLTMCKHW